MAARLAVGLALALGATTAAADGKVFAKVAHAPVPMADQRALLHWEDGVETLVIGSSFAGPGTDFAWVVPLPAVPEAAVADRGVLTTLAVVVQPRIIHRPSTGWALVAFVVLVLGAMLTYEPLRRALAKQRVAGVGLVLILFFLVASMMLPMLAGVGSPRQLPTGVRILAFDEVGYYTLTTIQGEESGALAAWLRDAGYDVPAAALPTIEQHARRGGVFVAARLSARLATEHVRDLQPLRFRFPTATPVYPMALTGAGSTTPLALELYVFGPERAHVPGMATVRCSQVVLTAPHDPTSSGEWGSSDALAIGHPELLALINGAPVATHLRATLEPMAMLQDLEVAWVPYAPVGEWVYTASAALAVALDVWVSIACALLYATLAIRQARRRPQRLGTLLVIVGGCAVAGLTYHATLPTTDGQIELAHPARIEGSLNCLHEALYTDGTYDDSTRLDRAWFGAELVRLRDARALDKGALRNPFTGEPVTLEASPGNVTLTRRADGQVEFLAYDATGAPSLRGLLPAKPSAPPPSPGAPPPWRFAPDDFRMTVQYFGPDAHRYFTFATASASHQAWIVALAQQPRLVAFVATPGEIRNWSSLMHGWVGADLVRDGRFVPTDGFVGYAVEIETAGTPMHAVLGWDVETYDALDRIEACCWESHHLGLRPMLDALGEVRQAWVARRYRRLLETDWHRIVVLTGSGSCWFEGCSPVLEAVREPGGVRIRPADAALGLGRLVPPADLEQFQQDLYRYALHHVLHASGSLAGFDVYAIEMQATPESKPERVFYAYDAEPLAKPFDAWIADWIQGTPPASGSDR